MGLFDDALGNARDAVKATFGRPMTFTALADVKSIKPSLPDPSRMPLDVIGVLHEFVLGRRGQSEVIERSDGGRPGGRFGVDLNAGPIRISVDVADLCGWLPPDGTLITIPGQPTDSWTVRRFEITQSLPTNGGRQQFFVSEIKS